MKAFHGDLAVKEKYLARLKAHHAADEIIQGTGYDGSHGCAVGCTLEKYDHNAYEHELGLPQWLARLEDRVFEGLPAIEAQQFAVDFLESVPVGANVEKVRWQLAVKRHAQARDRLLSNKKPYAVQCVAAIEQVIACCELKLSGSEDSAASASWSAKSAAASASAASASWSAKSAAWSAAWSAKSAASAASASWSAESAAESAESESAESESDHYKWEAKTLLELLRAAPQGE